MIPSDILVPLGLTLMLAAVLGFIGHILSKYSEYEGPDVAPDNE